MFKIVFILSIQLNFSQNRIHVNKNKPMEEINHVNKCFLWNHQNTLHGLGVWLTEITRDGNNNFSNRTFRVVDFTTKVDISLCLIAAPKKRVSFCVLADIFVLNLSLLTPHIDFHWSALSKNERINNRYVCSVRRLFMFWKKQIEQHSHLYKYNLVHFSSASVHHTQAYQAQS